MWAALASAAGNVASSWLGSKQADKNNAAQAALAQQNIQQQREFAQQGIQWKVADAKAAGIHPLYALGAQTTSFAPVSAGSSSSDFGGLGKAGQDIGRAIDATRDGPGKIGALQTSIAAAQLDGLRIDNDIKRAELGSKLATNSARNPGIPQPGGYPGSPFNGQGDAIKIDGPRIKVETRRDVTDPQSPAYIPGAGPSVGYARNATGGYTPIIPPEIAESMESDWAGRWDWMLRNRVLPHFSGHDVPNIPRGSNEYVEWNPWLQQWEIRKHAKGTKIPDYGKALRKR